MTPIHSHVKRCIRIWAPVLLVLAGCTNPKLEQLPGNWQGTQVLEEGEPLPIDPSVIQLQIASEGTYRYDGTLKYSEAGHWSLHQDLLFTRDTTRADAEEKAVLIERLEGDTLVLKMNESGKERRAFFLRKQ